MNSVHFSWESIESASASRPDGYIQDIIAHGTLHMAGDQKIGVTLPAAAYEALRAKYQPGYKPKPVEPTPPPPPPSGPGTELKKLLSMIGITAKPNCSCNARAKTMDQNGSEWCRANIDRISQWLREEATKRKLPYSDMAGKALISLAIRRAEKAQASMPKTDTPGT